MNIRRNFARLRARPSLPTVDSACRESWAAGWWAGIAVGAVNGIGYALIAFMVLR